MNVLAATRKGLFNIQLTNNSAVIQAQYFAGEALSQVLVDERDGIWYAAQNLGHFGLKMKRSRNQGKSWEDIAAPALPIKPAKGQGPWANDPQDWNILQVWTLAAGSSDMQGELWAGCMPAALFRSVDYGETWQLIEALWFNEKRLEWFGGGNDSPGIHSVVVDPRDGDRITLGISCGGVWKTLDRGGTWRLIGKGQEADYLPPEVAANLNQQDPHRLVACASAPNVIWVQHHGGQYVSTDGAENLQRVNKGSGYEFGFAVAVDPNDPDRAWFVPAKADTHRYAQDGALCVLRTDDGGKSFQQLRNGLPQHSCFDLVYRHSLIVDSGGQHLVMASTTGHIWFSRDTGEQWQVASMLLPPIYAISYVSENRVIA